MRYFNTANCIIEARVTFNMTPFLMLLNKNKERQGERDQEK